MWLPAGSARTRKPLQKEMVFAPWCFYKSHTQLLYCWTPINTSNSFQLSFLGHRCEGDLWGLLLELWAKPTFLSVTKSTTTHKCTRGALECRANDTVVELALSFLHKASFWDRSLLIKSLKLSFIVYSSHSQKAKFRGRVLFVQVIFNCLLVLFAVCGLQRVMPLTAEALKQGQNQGAIDFPAAHCNQQAACSVSRNCLSN